MMPLGPVVGGSGLNPADLKQKISMNVDNVVARISGIAPQHISEEVCMELPPASSTYR